MGKKLTFSFWIFLSCNFIVNAQLSENFNDGNFISNPSWTGDTSSFFINSSLQLQSNNLNPNVNFYLAAENKYCAATECEYWMRLAFNPSSANYIDTYLTSSTNKLFGK